MARVVDHLTPENLPWLPGGAATSTYWQFTPVERARLQGDELAANVTWLRGVREDWGSCGRVVRIDDEPVAYALWAPPVYLPGGEGFPTSPISPDAVLFATAYVDPGHRGGGLGRFLVHLMVKDLLKRGDVAAVEAYGGPGNDDSRGVLPVGFLEAVGFRCYREHASYPRVRLELSTTVTWRQEFEAALARLRGAVRPPRPLPADRRLDRLTPRSRAANVVH